MKRSSIVNLIANRFYENNVEPEDADREGEELLAELEKIGMRMTKRLNPAYVNAGENANVYRISKYIEGYEDEK